MSAPINDNLALWERGIDHLADVADAKACAVLENCRALPEHDDTDYHDELEERRAEYAAAVGGCLHV